MAVWVFGDSFAQLLFDILRSPYDQWGYIIAKDLGTEIKHFGRGGTSLDYTYHTYNEHTNNIKSGDVVIVTLTELDRRWFWNDKPELGCVHSIKIEDPSIANAYKLYELYLNNKELPKVYLKLFLSELNMMSLYKGVHVIILPCFYDVNEYVNKIKEEYTNLHIANEMMLTVSMNEFKESLRNSPDIEKYFTRDARVTHLIKSNHSILASKLLDNIKNKTPIDFTKGFIEGALDLDIIQNIEYNKHELFNAHLYSYSRFY